MTPFQTVGPFFDFGLDSRPARSLRPSSARTADRGRGLAARRSGRSCQGCDRGDLAGERRRPIPPSGRRSGRAARPCVRWLRPCRDDGDGHFSFSTVMPGRVAGPDGRLQAPHLLVSVMARGVLTRLATRIYFENEPANADDPILELVPGNGAGRSSLASQARTGTRSTSSCRAPARPFSSTCRGKGGAGLMTEVERAFAEDTRVQKMLDVEAALARAEAQAGIIPASAAEAIARASRVDRFDLPTIVADAHPAGNLAIPLVKRTHSARRGRRSRVEPVRALGRNEPGHHRYRPRSSTARRRSRSSFVIFVARGRSPRRRTRNDMHGRRWPGGRGCSRRRRSHSA